MRHLVDLSKELKSEFSDWLDQHLSTSVVLQKRSNCENNVEVCVDATRVQL